MTAKKSCFRILLFSLLLIVENSSIATEQKAAPANSILGEWYLEATAPQLDAKKTPETRVWNFGLDGKITTSGFSQEFSKPIKHTFNFHIDGGKIVTESPGRPGKSVTYEVIELSPDHMTLKGGLAGYYFFSKQPVEPGKFQ